MNFSTCKQNSPAMPHLGLCCLPMSYKKDAGLKRVNSYKPGVLFNAHRQQYRPRWDAAKCGVPSGAILFAKNFIKNEIKKI